MLQLLVFVVRSNNNNRKIGRNKRKMQKRILPGQYPSIRRYWQRSPSEGMRTKPSRSSRRSILLGSVCQLASSVCPRVLLIELVYTIFSGIASPCRNFFDFLGIYQQKTRQSTKILVPCPAFVTHVTLIFAFYEWPNRQERGPSGHSKRR